MEPSPPDPVPETPDVPAAPAKPRRRVLRQALIVGLSVLALLCLGGGAAAFLFYDKATKPDLSSPVLATEQYLTAYFKDRDDAKAEQYRCASASGLSEVQKLRNDIEAHEKSLGITYDVSVDGVHETGRQGNEATVAASLVFVSTFQGQSRREVDKWQFTTRNDGGWRVCDGHEVT